MHNKTGSAETLIELESLAGCMDDIPHIPEQVHTDSGTFGGPLDQDCADDPDVRFVDDTCPPEYRRIIEKLQDDVRFFKGRVAKLEQRLNLHPKTGLRNQYRMQHELDDLLDRAKTDTSPQQRALCIIRLDSNFDTLNKTFKSSMSDWILYQIGVRLDEMLLDEEELYHTRDDEFVLFVSRFQSRTSLVNRVESFLSVIQKPHVLAGRHIFLSANAGLALYPQNGNHRSVLLHAADLALDKARQERRRFCIFEDEIRSSALRRMDLHASLLNALEANADLAAQSQFSLAFQPLVYLEKSKNDDFRCREMDAEVLLRWKHPNRGSIAPDDFIPFSEESGLILPIGNWVMYQVLEQLKAWQDTPLQNVCLSVNISPKQFMNDQLMRKLSQELKANPGLHKRLKLEITETCLLENPDRSIQRMQYLNKLGLRFSLDDFGKGYSSLSYLSRLPIDSIKLDRQFVVEAETKPASLAIIKAVILMAAKMKLKLICEGVETKEQLNRLLTEGARGFQGYYFSKPASALEYEQIYQNRVAIHHIPDQALQAK